MAFADRDGSRGAGIAAQIEAAGGDVLFVEARMDRESEATDFIRRATEHFGRLDILVNNAAIRLYHSVTEASEDSWDAIWAVNVKGYAFCARAAIPYLRKSGKGSIVNIASNSAVIASRNAVQYDTTKGSGHRPDQGNGFDHAEEGIRVNALCPGPTFTPFHQKRAAAAGENPPPRSRKSSDNPPCSGGQPCPRRSPPASCSWHPTTPPSSPEPASSRTEENPPWAATGQWGHRRGTLATMAEPPLDDDP